MTFSIPSNSNIIYGYGARAEGVYRDTNQTSNIKTKADYHLHRGMHERQQVRFTGKLHPTPRETRGQRGVRLAKTLSNNTSRAKFRGRRFDVTI